MEIFGIVLLAFIAIAYFMYAGLIKTRNKVLESLGGIDVQLNKRHEVIPNVLTIAKKFMEHEKTLLEEVTKLRTQAMKPYDKSKASEVGEHLQIESLLQGKMGQLMVSVENYPDLKSDDSMYMAQKTYNEIEEHIAASRRFYNSSVTDLNNKVQIFPSSVIAKMINIGEMPFFEAEDSVKQPIAADSIL